VEAGDRRPPPLSEPPIWSGRAIYALLDVHNLPDDLARLGAVGVAR
jgi:hypothetical protein